MHCAGLRNLESMLTDSALPACLAEATALTRLDLGSVHLGCGVAALISGHMRQLQLLFLKRLSVEALLLSMQALPSLLIRGKVGADRPLQQCRASTAAVLRQRWHLKAPASPWASEAPRALATIGAY